MKRLNKCLLATMLALSGLAGAITATAQNEKAKSVEAVSLSTLVSKKIVWSTATSDANFEWSAPLRTVNDFNIGWVGLSTQYYISNFTWKYKNNEQNIVDSMTFTKMYFDTNNSSASLSVSVSTIVDGVVKKTQSIPATHLSYPNTHWVSNNIVTVTGLSSLVGNKQVSFKFEATGSTTRFGFVKDESFSVSGYASTKVTLDNQGGSTNSSVYLVEGYPMPNVSVPTKEDHEFDGYYSDVEGGGTKYYNADGTPALESAGNASTLYAKWNRVGTNITLNKDGGTGGDDSTVGVLDQTLADVIVPTKSGYTFNGYYSEPNGQGTQYYNENGQSSFVWNSTATSTTFYASWTIKEAVQNAINKIDAIGEVKYPDSKDDIDAARNAYDAVESADQGGVSNYQTLVDAEATYETLKQNGVTNVKTLINNIGVVTLDKEQAIINARAAYNALTNEQKALVDESFVNTLTAAEERLSELKVKKASADAVVSLIDAIGEVKYPDSKDAINAARTAYEALDNEAKGFVSNYETLVNAEATYETLKQNGVTNVKTLINNIGVVTLDKEQAILDARAAYTALTDEQKALVDEGFVNTLTAAEERLAELKVKKASADAVVSLIDAIGEVSYPASNEAITAARTAYEALDNEAKGFVSNYETLVNAETTYETLKQNGATNVKTLINNIGVVTLDKEQAILDARAAYTALTDEQKALVDEGFVNTLTAAEERLSELKVKKASADAVVSLIDAIGEVKYPDSKDAINAARTAYEALDNEAKGFVSNYETLVNAEATYETLKQNGVTNVKTLINNIGVVTLEKEQAIINARAAYNALTDEQKALVDESFVNTLTAAEARLAELKAAKAKADVVVGLVDAIGEVSYPESNEAITAARNGYEALNEEERGFVSNYQTLLDAEASFDALKESEVDDLIAEIKGIGEVTLEKEDIINKARADYDALTDEQKVLLDASYVEMLENAEARLAELKAAKAKADVVVALIDAIGEVSYPESHDALFAAIDAYDALNQLEKSFVTNEDVLDDAIYAYVEAMAKGILAVDDEINAIGEVTLEKEQAILDAREHYNALTDEQKHYFNEEVYNILVDAEERLAELKEEKAHADAVVELINSIGEVSYPNSKDAIKEARDAYNALNDEEKGFVTNLDTLLAAEAKYDELRDKGVNDVKTLIDNIGEVTLTDASKAKIDEARAAYDALTAEQKELLGQEELSKLLAAEKAYKDLVDNSKADAVDALIDAIGTVEYTSDSKAKIDAAREAYDALTSEQKALVDHLSVLTHAEEVYKHVDNAATKIDAIGEVTLSDDSKAKIDSAKAAYDSLTAEEKALIGGRYSTLSNAEAKYAELVKTGKTSELVSNLFKLFGLGLGWIVILFFVGFLGYRKREKDDEDEAKKEAEAKRAQKQN